MKSRSVKYGSIFIGILLLTICASCQNKVKINEADKNTFEIWKGKTVILPWEEMSSNFSSKQTESQAISQKRLKILSLIDTSCPACIEELKSWKDFIQGVDTMHIGFIFLLYSSDQFLSLDEELIGKTLMYPYFKDINGSVFKKNKFPLDKKYQTFLLNSKNQIVLLGTPNRNAEMFNLYRDYIDKYFNERNVSGVVKGSITVNEGNYTKTRFATKPKYFLENGSVVEDEKAKEMIISLKYIPQINALTGEIILKKRD